MITNPTGPFFEFGPFRLDPAEHVLSRDGQTVLLTPKVFDILQVLVENGGHLFKKEELMQAVWADSFVEEGNLTRNISTLRTALGESPNEHKYIETVPKVGYRFVAPVRKVTGNGMAASSVSEPQDAPAKVVTTGLADDVHATTGEPVPAPRPKAMNGYRVWAIGAFALVAVMAGVYELVSRRARAPGASEYYSRAKLHTGTQNRPDNDAAIDLLEKEVAANPNFAPAYTALAVEYHSRGVALEPQDDEKWEAKAEEAVQKALALDPNLAQAHGVWAAMIWGSRNRFAHRQAINELRRALELNPNLDGAHQALGNIYNHIGLLDKAQEEILKAVAANPNNASAQFRVGVNLLYQSKYDKALNALREARKFSAPLWTYQMAFAFFQLGKKEDAAATVAEARTNKVEDEGGLLSGMEALLAAARGDTQTAEEKIKQAEAVGKSYVHFHHTEYAIASSYALMNKRAEALAWLQKAATDGFPCYPLYEKDPNLNNLRQDPQFIAFMAKLKEQWESYRKEFS